MARSLVKSVQRQFSQSRQEYRADYRGGRDTRFQSRLTGVSAAGSGADFHYRNEREFLHLRERARDYYRNSDIVGQGVRRLVANVVQEGFGLDVTTSSTDLNEHLKGKWQEWASNPDQCHSERELTFQQMERLCLSTVIVDGDVISLQLQEGSLQWIEAHRLRTPTGTNRNVVHGVLVDDITKERKEYWITKEDVGLAPVKLVREIKRMPARDDDGERFVNHISDTTRCSQTRGVSCLAPVTDTVGMHDDLQFATLVKAQMAALITIFRERELGYQSVADAATGDIDTETVGSYVKTIEGISAGLEFGGAPGEKLKGFSPEIPSETFVEHAMLILTFIAINLDLPVAVLLLDPSETNFSGWRGAVDQARLRFRQIQRWYSDAFHTPTYRWKVLQWIDEDPVVKQAFASGIDVFSHAWHRPGWPYIEPLKDAQADALQQEELLTSPRRIQAARGRDWEEVYHEIIEDNTNLITAAAAAATRLQGQGIDIEWRDVLNPTVKMERRSSETETVEGDNGTTKRTKGERARLNAPTVPHLPSRLNGNSEAN